MKILKKLSILYIRFCMAMSAAVVIPILIIQHILCKGVRKVSWLTKIQLKMDEHDEKRKGW